MNSIAIQLDGLRSPNKNKRYEACEQLRVAPHLPQEAIRALEQVSDDLDPDVADAARRALLAHLQDKTVFIGAPSRDAEEAPVQSAGPATDYQVMLKEIRSWGFWSLAWGVLHLIASGIFSAPWGLLLLVVGFGSLYFRTASMFIIYAVTLAWAALSNLMAGAGGWTVFALLQVIIALRVFWQFRRFRKTEEEFFKASSESPGRAADTESIAFSAEKTARFFPWAGLFLGGWSFLGLLAVWVAMVIQVAASQGTTPNLQVLGFLEGLVVEFGVLGFAISLASLLSGYRPKVVAIIGLGAGLLTMTVEYALYFVLSA